MLWSESCQCSLADGEGRWGKGFEEAADRTRKGRKEVKLTLEGRDSRR